MKLYMHPASITSRIVRLYAAEKGIALDEERTLGSLTVSEGLEALGVGNLDSGVGGFDPATLRKVAQGSVHYFSRGIGKTAEFGLR